MVRCEGMMGGYNERLIYEGTMGVQDCRMGCYYIIITSWECDMLEKDGMVRWEV